MCVVQFFLPENPTLHTKLETNLSKFKNNIISLTNESIFATFLHKQLRHYNTLFHRTKTKNINKFNNLKSQEFQNKLLTKPLMGKKPDQYSYT